MRLSILNYKFNLYRCSLISFTALPLYFTNKKIGYSSIDFGYWCLSWINKTKYFDLDNWDQSYTDREEFILNNIMPNWRK